MTLEENKAIWAAHDWRKNGEEWSKWWGTSREQWYWSIFPRIERYLPARTILEIATGCGRWTKFLIGYCEYFMGVDLIARCIATCNGRFADSGKRSFWQNDGKSLWVVPDGSVDFAFSFDSLPHSDEDVIASYIEQLASKLAPNGVAFIHHSNAGVCKVADGLRDPNMTAVKFADHCSRVGLVCVSQELVDWCSDELTDCFSIVSRGSGQEPVVIENHHFREEMSRAKALSPVAV